MAKVTQVFLVFVSVISQLCLIRFTSRAKIIVIFKPSLHDHAQCRAHSFSSSLESFGSSANLNQPITGGNLQATYCNALLLSCLGSVPSLSPLILQINKPNFDNVSFS